MLPIEKRNILIKNIKAGWDIRNSCDRSQISRSSLYQYYKEDPEFKIKVQKTIQTVLDRKNKTTKMSARHLLRKNKQILRIQNNKK